MFSLIVTLNESANAVGFKNTAWDDRIRSMEANVSHPEESRCVIA